MLTSPKASTTPSFARIRFATTSSRIASITISLCSIMKTPPGLQPQSELSAAGIRLGDINQTISRPLTAGHYGKRQRRPRFHAATSSLMSVFGSLLGRGLPHHAPVCFPNALHEQQLLHHSTGAAP